MEYLYIPDQRYITPGAAELLRGERTETSGLSSLQIRQIREEKMRQRNARYYIISLLNEYQLFAINFDSIKSEEDSVEITDFAEPRRVLFEYAETTASLSPFQRLLFFTR